MIGKQQNVQLQRMQELMDCLAEALAVRVADKIRPAQPAKLLTLRQAGEMIGRSAGAVNQLIKRGELRGVVCGRRIHIQVKEIEDWIDRCGTR